MPEFQRGLLAEIGKLKVGDPSDQDTDVGPMITAEDARRIESWVEEALRGGAKLLIGGKREESCFWPTALTNVTAEMKVTKAEVFAPLVCLSPYQSFEQALSWVNDSVYGLQVGIFTNEIDKAFQAVKKVNVGGVMINDASSFRADHMPYGGVKQSGSGREGVRFAIEEMTAIKMISFNLKK